MKKLKSILSLSLAMLFISAMTLSSCGGKKEANSEAETEQVEGGEHPEGEHPEGEHPSEGDSTEHPAGGEHPTEGDSTEHPTDN